MGSLVVFVILFYVITFAVYYFYSPGPEERKQAAAELANRAQSQQIQDAVNGTAVTQTQQAGPVRR